MQKMIKNALISVYDKKGIERLAKELCGFGIKIIATSGTASFLKENGIEVKSIEDIIDVPELLGGRVKTLHPGIFAAILADREKEEHITNLKRFGLEFIDLVVVNLYPFEEGLKEGREAEDMIELIDIGGASLLRASSKNYKYCVSLCSPSQYEGFLEEMKANGGEVSLQYRLNQAMKVFKNISRYDHLIANYFGSFLEGKEEELFPDVFTFDLKKVIDLRYGENPHQRSALYREPTASLCILDATVLSGKPMSYNNWMDTDAAVSVVAEFNTPAVAIMKHASPCGVGTGENIYDAYNKAYITDPVSAFGGIIASNREIDLQTAEDIIGSFFEVVIAPSFEGRALKKLCTKKNLRILKTNPEVFSVSPSIRCYSLKGGMLFQEGDSAMGISDDWEVVSDREPTEKELKSLEFAWKVVKWVKSNGIVIAMGDRAIGIGTGQPSRVDSVELAIKKAGSQGHYTGGTALASDGFFPFRDAIDAAARAGVSAIVEPGGSIRDQQVIEAANEHEIALLFTGTRHFRH